MSSIEYSVGLLYRGAVRNYLERKKFLGTIDFLETKNWLDSDFVVKGESEAVSEVIRDLEQWFKEIREDQAKNKEA